MLPKKKPLQTIYKAMAGSYTCKSFHLCVTCQNMATGNFKEFSLFSCIGVVHRGIVLVDSLWSTLENREPGAHLIGFVFGHWYCWRGCWWWWRQCRPEVSCRHLLTLSVWSESCSAGCRPASVSAQLSVRHIHGLQQLLLSHLFPNYEFLFLSAVWKLNCTMWMNSMNV